MSDEPIIIVEFAGIPLALTRTDFQAARERARDQIGRPLPTLAVENSGPGGDMSSPGAVEPLLTSDQLAALLGLSASWVEQAARERRIPTFKFGRWTRFKLSEVEVAVRAEKGNRRR